jgi:hypothetical protein
MSVDYVTSYVLKPAASAAFAGAAAIAWRGSGQMVNVGGKAVPLALVVAGASFLASEVSELINTYLFDHIPQIGALSHPMHTALAVGAQIGVVAGVENYLAPGLVGEQGLAEVAGICLLSEITSTYVVNEYLKPWYATMSGASSTSSY